jgi:uncharacterized protein YlxP (DUF503 family)
VVSAITIKILIHDSGSLKSKRNVVKSIKERLKNRFNIAVAEVGDLERLNYAEIGIATIGNDNRLLEETLQNVVRFLENDYRFELLETVRII